MGKMKIPFPGILLKDKGHGYYWILYEDDSGRHLNGPHSDKPINLPEILVDNPASYEPPADSGERSE